MHILGRRSGGVIFPAREMGWLIGAGTLIFILARYTPMDHALTALFYNPAARQFPFRDQPFWAVILHSGLKYLSIAVWFALLVYWIRLRRQPTLPTALQRALGFMLLVAPLAALVVSSLRAFSMHSCPWELSRYGGAADYFRFFDTVPPNPGAGRCAPSGHAAAGFAWLAGYIALRHVHRNMARLVLVLTLTLGFLTGLTQLVRGAHFISHVLLTAWICFATAWAADVLRQAWSVRRDLPTGAGENPNSGRSMK